MEIQKKNIFLGGGSGLGGGVWSGVGQGRCNREGGGFGLGGGSGWM